MFLLLVSVAVTALLYLAGVPFFFLFLFIPLIPLMQKEARQKKCPRCGWQTNSDTIGFCPYDGSALLIPDREQGE